MSDAVIEVDNISKLYRLGAIGTGSFRQDLQRWWNRSVSKKEDPFYLHEKEQAAELRNNTLWALNNVSFEVKQGEVLGIIGSNGSGKSTLLKIISRIVQPTNGTVRGRGKISSILEVGTGFNQELTGRENIYISGYTLGMSKVEIRNKFDEIVEFSGIENFLDTPVKRYSSGMYIRLAFSVAAHLEPDILIIDEVLAVGDADFQKKCLGKMQNVSDRDGRTILFVSHNLQAVANLCTNALWLEHGKIKMIGSATAIVNSYTRSFRDEKIEHSWDTPDFAPGNESVRLKSAQVRPQTDHPDGFITVRTPICMTFDFWCFLDDGEVNVNVILLTHVGECVFNLGSHEVPAERGVLTLETIIPGNLLNNAKYTVSLKFIRNNSTFIHEFSNCITFEVEDVREEMHYFGTWPGIIRPQIDSTLSFKKPVHLVQPGFTGTIKN